MTAATHTLGTAIEGSHGTIVFGNGVTALTGYVVEAAPDHIVLDTNNDQPAARAGALHVIPLAAIAYFRYSDA